jgi:NAD(P)-dependent dehydrogenase (short-subunit alcohol dehydrogenase family)
MDGKVVAITGCTTGTGAVCAMTCAQLGARIIMLNRPSTRANNALADLRKVVPGCSASLVPCDLRSFESVRVAGALLREELASCGLDVLCNNAGIMAAKDEATVDGCDTQMQTNHMSHFLLTAELWPLLVKAASLRGEARVVNQTSVARGKQRLDEKFLRKNGGNLGGDGFARWTRYQQSKLASLVFTYALRDRQNTVKALVAHPGVASTNLQVSTAQNGGMWDSIRTLLIPRIAQSCEDGSMGILRCCCEAGVKSGDFFGPGPSRLKGEAVLIRPGPEEAIANEAARELLWRVSCEVTDVTFSL